MAKDPRWWRSKNPHMDAGEAIKAAEKADSVRRGEEEHHLRLYSEREWALYNAADARAKVTQAYKARKRRRLSTNVVRNYIDGWVNLICRSRPHVTYLTKGADWGLQRRARLRTRFVEAHFLKRNLYTRAPRICKHAGIFGSGFVQVVKRSGRIDYEPVMPGELVIDPREALADDPRSFYRVRTMDKHVALEEYPGAAEQIKRAKTVGDGTRIVFADCWHLPSGPDADDGLHVEIIPGEVTLRKRRYRWQSPPIVPFRFDDAPIGWFGSGIAEELSGIQYEINSVLRTIQNNAYMGGNLKVAVPRGSNIVASGALSNALGVPIIEYNGNQPPTFFAHDVVSPQLFAHLERLERRAAEIIGMSQMNVESTTPFASMSGRARLAHDASYSRRFVTHQQRYEQFFNDLADRTLEAADDLAKDDQDLEIIFPGRDHLEVVRYSDVAGEPEDFDCQAWSASLAGETPAARLAHIEQMMALGMIDLPGAMYLYEIPHDLRAHMEMVLAPIELAREAIDRIVEDGVPMTPTPVMDLKMCAKHAGLWYQRGVLRGADPQRLYLLLDFQKLALFQLQNAAPVAGAPPMPAGAGAPPELTTGPTLPVAPAAPMALGA